MLTTQVDWEAIDSQLVNDGVAIFRGLPDAPLVRSWAQSLCSGDCALRALEDADVPESLVGWLNELYGRLCSIANSWREALGDSSRFPPAWSEFLARGRAAGQTRTQSFAYRLRDSEYRSLHQLGEGEHVFPLQVLVLLSEPGRDFSGGELVMTERRPRMQSKPLVVPLGFGDAALIPTAKRPVKGTRGYYSTAAKHGVSRVRGGERLGLELAFNDAPPI